MKFKIRKLIGLSLFTAVLLQSNLNAEEKTNTKSLGSVDIVSTNISENTGSYTVESMNTSTKLDLSIRNTPQSISVISTQELKDKGITSYQSLLAHITGVSLNKWDERLKTSARGFDLDFFKIDGMPSYTKYNEKDLDLSLFDRVEVVRGANGLTTGAGNPGISINLVRKRANSKEFKGEVTLKAGSWNSYGINADIASKLNEKGNIRGRLVVNYEDEESYMDTYKKENTSIYGVIDADLSDTTYLSLGASYQNLDRSGIRWGGLPAFDSNGNRIDLDRSKIVSEDWTYWNSEVKSVFANLEQKLFNDISLNVSYTRNETVNDSALLYFRGGLNTNNGSGLSYLDFESKEKKQEDNIDVNFDIPFEMNGLTQQVILGASYNKDENKGANGRYIGGYGYVNVPNFYNYNIPHQGLSNSDVPYIIKPEDIVQKGIYLASRLSLSEDFKVIAGARLSSWEYNSTDTTKESRKFDNEITPYVGLVYDLDDNHSLYASYTSIFNPQDKKDKYDKYLDPSEGKSFELGAKGEYFDGVLNTSISLFEIQQDGVAEKKGKQIKDNTKDAYIAAEGVTSKGIEFDISGQVTDKLDLSFGIANFKAEKADGKKFNTQASRTTANLFAKYEVTNKLTLGGGLQYKSKFYTDVTLPVIGEKRIQQDAYTLVNAMGSYKINKNTLFQLNIDNIFDKKYYTGIGTNSMTYGEPRKITASLKYNF